MHAVVPISTDIRCRHQVFAASYDFVRLPARQSGLQRLSWELILEEAIQTCWGKLITYITSTGRRSRSPRRHSNQTGRLRLIVFYAPSADKVPSFTHKLINFCNKIHKTLAKLKQISILPRRTD